MTRHEWAKAELAVAIERLARRYAKADGIADWRECVDEARADMRDESDRWLDGATA